VTLNEDFALSYPELYKELTKVPARLLRTRNFLVLTSNRATLFRAELYLTRPFLVAHDQPLSRFAGSCAVIVFSAHLVGAAIMIISLVLFENEFLNIVAISFTALILNELIMVALEITSGTSVVILHGAF
jgi:ABC-type multidrug transport system permease subunit